MSPRRAVVAITVGTLTLALAACDPGGTEPTAAPSSVAPSTTEAPASPAPTEEPTSVAPEVPAPNPADFPGMEQQTEEGAKQAFKFYIASLVHAHRTGNSGTLQSLSTPNCGYCATVFQDIAAIHERRAFWGETPITPGEVSSISESESSVTVTYAFDLAEHQEFELDTGAPSIAPARTYGSSGRMVWADQGWRMDGLSIK
ncbi:DUF6318 family protein [Brachybacterium sp. AOP25-B2-12]|uniref:DUF6318 family protein n=1 Tax=Brachybacterium sp. AOP25-B2-12 TaxID=3457710 RepID=UPI004034C957